VFISEAHAQAAEVTQAATQAAGVLLEYKLLGAFCVFLLIAVGFLSWRLSKMQDRYAELVGQIATIAESSKAAITAQTSATERMQSAQAVAAEALREQGQETAKEIQENRHTVANHLAGVNAVMELLARQRQGAA
jgi:F0F1-type ATP synthase membrane subunit b/b'